METVKGAIFLVLATLARPEPVNPPGQRDCFELQVGSLLQKVCASPDRLRSLGVVRSAVELTLNAVWPGSKVQLFGSLSTGLGSPTSDVDLSVTVPNGYGSDVIQRARTAFEASPETYQHLHTRGRLPALTFHFAPTDVTCDVNFRNEATYESALLHYLLSLDERALKLAIIVKHWAKSQKLISSKYLTSYGMMLLVVFYLQQRSSLPSVIELQRNCPAHILSGPNPFNVAFGGNITVSRNNASLYQILGGFFEYYENFDFDQFMVCPYTGQLVRKRLFERVDTVPDEFYLYKLNVASNITQPLNVTAVCVQSLLMLNDNSAWRVDSATRFLARFRHAAQSFRENNKCTFLKASGVAS